MSRHFAGIFFTMKQIQLTTKFKKLLADIYTPVGIYLRLRDRFRDTILLESTDFHAGENSFSIIGINAIAGMEISNYREIEYKLPRGDAQKIPLTRGTVVTEELWKFMQLFSFDENAELPVNKAQGLFGYTTFDAVQFFEDIAFHEKAQGQTPEIPLVRYRLYQYVIVINHFKDELFLCENHIQGIESELEVVESLIKSKDVPVYPFSIQGNEESPLSDKDYMDMVQKGIASCMRGDVFQVVLSRKFTHRFAGDEFNVYRALRNINPSPYLFYFDYGDYRLFGSSPESQLIVQNGYAIVHPIAGTFRRTGNDAVDEKLAEALTRDTKENAEHVMLVDLARNDLSRICHEVTVSHFCEVQYFSHVIHLVSEVKGKVDQGTNPFNLLGTTFPAGTLSGAPKYKAMQLIDDFEKNPRSYYGGCIGYIGCNGSVNHAIMIRTFLSRQNTLVYRAGAGIVAASQPSAELQEVTNKLNALKQAMIQAETI